MQPYFLSMATPILGSVLSMVEACRSEDIRVIFIQHGHKNVSKENGMLAEWLEDLIPESCIWLCLYNIGGTIVPLFVQ
jgi:nicotinamidase-related amidase